MKQKIILILFQLTLLYQGVSAQNIQDVLRHMPDSIMPVLTENNVLDFMDYMVCDMKAEVTNKLGGKSEMTALGEDFTAIRISTNSTIQLKLLPYNGKKIIAMISSVSSDTKYIDSNIMFYSTDWEPLNSESFFNNKDSKEFCNMEMNADNTNIVISFSDPLELDKDAKGKESIQMMWNGNRFE